jgi:hypothetical protein
MAVNRKQHRQEAWLVSPRDTGSSPDDLLPTNTSPKPRSSLRERLGPHPDDEEDSQTTSPLPPPPEPVPVKQPVSFIQKLQVVFDSSPIASPHVHFTPKKILKETNAAPEPEKVTSILEDLQGVSSTRLFQEKIVIERSLTSISQRTTSRQLRICTQTPFRGCSKFTSSSPAR